jgi:ABC-2 type transport system ATP-binding protein
MIETAHLSKTFREKIAVDDLTFVAQAGRVTGFLGPNGAGKSTTMRMILGLDRPTAGQVTVGGHRYASLNRPLHHVGSLLDAAAVPAGRSARNHLRALARSNGIGAGRVDDVLAEVGLSDVARRRIGGFSLGMKQRLGIAGALLGDPQVLIFDEPVNGLDPAGVRWIRGLFRRLAGEGRTVLVSSHLMSEMALTADDLVVIGQGRLIAQTTVADFTTAAGISHVHVAAPRTDELVAPLRRAHATVTVAEDGSLRVEGLAAQHIGEIALRAAVPLRELHTVDASLEEAFMRLTDNAVEFRAHEPAAAQETR